MKLLFAVLFACAALASAQWAPPARGPAARVPLIRSPSVSNMLQVNSSSFTFNCPSGNRFHVDVSGTMEIYVKAAGMGMRINPSGVYVFYDNGDVKPLEVPKRAVEAISGAIATGTRGVLVVFRFMDQPAREFGRLGRDFAVRGPALDENAGLNWNMGANTGFGSDLGAGARDFLNGLRANAGPARSGWFY